jgi:hypothetical protein
VARERTLDGGRSSKVPPHQAPRSNPAITTIHGGDVPLGRIKRLKLNTYGHKVRHPTTRSFLLRQLRFGAVPEGFGYMVTIDEDQKTLSIRPKCQIHNHEMITPIPLSRVLNIHHGKDGCTHVMLVMSRAEGAIHSKMHLELESDKEVYDFVTTVQRLAGGTTNVYTKERYVFQRHLI